MELPLQSAVVRVVRHRALFIIFQKRWCVGNVVFNDEVGKSSFFGHAEKCLFFFMPRTHDWGTRRKWNIVFLDEFLVRLVEKLDKLSLRTHCQDQISSFSNAVTYNTYDSRGSSIPLAQPLGLLLLISCYCVLSKSLVGDDLHFSVCYSVTNVLSPLQTLLLPKVRSRLILYSEHARVS